MDGLDAITSRRDFSGEIKYIESGEPIEAFKLWMKEAQDEGIPDPHAMVLGTIGENGPSTRVVYLRDIDGEDMIFYTNYKSSKAQDIDKDDRVSLLFYWQALDVQVRIEGRAQKVAKDVSDQYFENRPRGSQIGAWASEQSSPLSSREELEERYEKVKEEFEGKQVECPPFWGGYLVRPERIEFWVGRPSRLHDRILFTKGEDGSWQMSRMYP